jgi:glycosyltransferase involved in cell wall biosynthesis
VTGVGESVSVVIPVRDGERFLGEAIESALQQAPPLFEVLVVDDGSTDATPWVARSFGAAVTYVRRPALGVAAALNHGASLARGSLLAFLDADDVWSDHKLGLQVAALRDDARIEAVFGHLANVGEDGVVRETFAGYSRGTMLIRRDAFDRVGPFAAWRLGEFVEWYARAVDAGVAMRMLPEVLLLRRVHDANTGVRLRDERTEYARMLKSILDRRRAEAT